MWRGRGRQHAPAEGCLSRGVAFESDREAADSIAGCSGGTAGAEGEVQKIIHSIIVRIGSGAAADPPFEGAGETHFPGDGLHGFLLETTQDKLDVIAQLLGFTDGLTFSRAFKRWIGLNPSEYRQRH